MLHKIRFPYRKPRPVPYNSAPEAEQGEFERRTSVEVGRLAGHGYTVFGEDEALRRLSAAAGYGWFPINGNESPRRDPQLGASGCSGSWERTNITCGRPKPRTRARSWTF